MLKIGFDARYIRVDHHDGISRFSTHLGQELYSLTADDPRVDVTYLVSEVGQLQFLPQGCAYALISPPTSPREVAVARQVNRLGLDIVFSPMQTMGSLGRKYRLVLTVHDLIYYNHPQAPRQFSWPIRALWRLYHLAWWPQRLLLKGCDAVVTISQTTRELLGEHRLTDKPVFIVPNAAEQLPAVRRTKRNKSLVYMGSFMPYKNVETLVAAARELPDYTLHLLSRIHHRDRVRLEGLAHGANLVFHNGVDDAHYSHLLAEATAAVTASRDEGFGIPVIEAMAQGTPVICSDIPIFREIGGEAALYAEVDDPDAFVTAVRTLEDPKNASRLSKQGLSRAATFNWHDSATVLLNVLVELGSQPSSKGF
jgi:glycosyltransferase involved in cell wall biosynthesis